MPYEKDSPPERIKGLPVKAQHIWVEAFNSAWKEYDGDEERCNKIAWGAVKNAGYEKNKDGKWVKMGEPDQPDFDQVEIFEVGVYPQGTFTEADLDQIVANFNPSYHEPPATLDHIQDGPAYGWVEKIWRSGNKLMAKFKQISQDLKTWVQEGKYKKRSIELWNDFEGTGKLVLKAVTWLGAHPPQVKGLQNQFQSFTDKHGRVICPIQPAGDKSRKMEVDMEFKEFQGELEKQTKTFEAKFGDLTKTFSDKVDALTEENKKLKEKIDSNESRFSHQDLLAKEKRIDTEISQLLKDGKITPAHVDAGLKVFLMAQPEGIKLTFGEGTEKKEISVIDYAIDLFSNKIKGAPVHFGEIAPPDRSNPIGTASGIAFKVVGSDESITEDSLDLHEKTVKFMEEHNSKNPQHPLDYKGALLEVSRQQ